MRRRSVDPAPAITLADLKGDAKIKYQQAGFTDPASNGKMSRMVLRPGPTFRIRENSQPLIQSGSDGAAVTLGGLYDEVGREFACEAQRRTNRPLPEPIQQRLGSTMMP